MSLLPAHRNRRQTDGPRIGGAAAALPVVARAQQPGGMRRVGILMPLTADDPYDQARLAAFLQGPQEAGWSVRSAMVMVRI